MNWRFLLICIVSMGTKCWAENDVNLQDPNLAYSQISTYKSHQYKHEDSIFSVVIDKNQTKMMMSLADLESYLKVTMKPQEAKKITEDLLKNPQKTQLKGLRVVAGHLESEKESFLVELDKEKFEANILNHTQTDGDSLYKKIERHRLKKPGAK